MSREAAIRPAIQLVGDQSVGYCDPETGACILPGASDAPASGEQPSVIDAG